MITKQEILINTIKLNAVLEEVEIHRTKLLQKCIPDKELDGPDIKIIKEGYLEEVPNYKNVVDHLELYKSLFEKCFDLNKKIIDYLEEKKPLEKKEKKSGDENEYITVEGEEDDE